MEQYSHLSYELARHTTNTYSTSFSMSSRLFARSIRHHIYAIYGLVRIADEIVDTYRGDDSATQLEHLHQQTRTACQTGYSSNPIVHAFAITARAFAIDHHLIDPFFDSMAMDLTQHTWNETLYKKYIYGSAEVVGLMCLNVFVSGDETMYQKQSAAAKALGAAYQKINFLRDFAADARELKRVYFPGVTYDSFDENTKLHIIDDITRDMTVAYSGIAHLPDSARRAVRASYLYYQALLETIANTPATMIKQKRIRITNAHKLVLLAQARAGL